ncbi:molecular chaperone DnaJ [Natrinema sp. CBA1119]|uniref:J domain-containing protein n=1 Tax=Natrinema sp. CBA1119 TaxID=1608465 RepID=UPI000BFA79EF|nr:J domain-containing protein [Natrinema sp. CBA1119]PGF16193.1 molecular chaperone DnaJ [Natrinema sp. CBA1119]
MSSTQSTHERTIDWPRGHGRTDPIDRESYPGDLSPTRKESFQSVVDELEAWEATEGSVRIETASQHYADRPNIPHQHDKPDDVGVAAYFRREGEAADHEFAVSCDCWETQRENARAIALWARRQRLAERCGVQTAADTVETARLPPADEEAIATPPASSEDELDKEPHEILEVAPGASDDVVTAVVRRKSANVHPDSDDPDVAEYKRIQKAKEAMLE